MWAGLKQMNLAAPCFAMGMLFFSSPAVLADSSCAAITPPAVSSDLQVTEKRIDGNVCTVATISVNAPTEKVWKVMTDYQRAPRVFHNLKCCEIIGTKGNTKYIHQVVQPIASPLKYDYVIELTETKPRLIKWRRISGSLRQLVGSWELVEGDQANTTKIVYTFYIDGGFFLPAWLMRLQAKSYVPNTLIRLKQASETEEIVVGP
jgi:uncharacterized membrane protein